MRYLLDTNIISDLVRNPQGLAARRLAAVGDANVATSIIVASELRYGCAKKGSEQLTERVEAVLSLLPILALEAPADVHYGGIRADLEKRGLPIGQNDLFIAAHATALDAVLVTANHGEFSFIQTLRTENWLA